MKVSAMKKNRYFTSQQQEEVRRKINVLWNSKGRNEFTQQQAADIFGITQTTFSNYLTGRLSLNPTFVFKFAELMHVSPEEIDPNLDKLIKNKYSIDIPVPLIGTASGYAALGTIQVPKKQIQEAGYKGDFHLNGVISDIPSEHYPMRTVLLTDPFGKLEQGNIVAIRHKESERPEGFSFWILESIDHQQITVKEIEGLEPRTFARPSVSYIARVILDVYDPDIKKSQLP